MAMMKLMAAGLLAAAMTVPAMAQTAGKYQSLSRELVAAGKVAMQADKSDEARELFERALVADPANVAALVGLGTAYEADGRVGRGLKYYRQALELEPNDMGALEAQALAFLKRDMVARAENNRDKLARLCTEGCPALEEVSTAIDAYEAAKADASTTSHAEVRKDG